MRELVPATALVEPALGGVQREKVPLPKVWGTPPKPPAGTSPCTSCVIPAELVPAKAGSRNPVTRPAESSSVGLVFNPLDLPVMRDLKKRI